METAWQFQLNLVPWQVFFHLSFRQLMPSMKGRMDHTKRLVRKIATNYLICEDDLAFVVRFEDGDRTGRPHCHMLMSRLPMKGASTRSCFVYKNWWDKIAGNAVVNPFRPDLAGVAYIAEGLTDRNPGNQYEMSKFGRADAVFVSPMARMEMLRARAFGRQRSSPTASRAV
jgi:hypothetical protein